MNTVQTLSSEKQHTSHSLTVFTSQKSTELENYLYDMYVCGGGNAWKNIQMYFYPY